LKLPVVQVQQAEALDAAQAMSDVANRADERHQDLQTRLPVVAESIGHCDVQDEDLFNRNPQVDDHSSDRQAARRGEGEEALHIIPLLDDDAEAGGIGHDGWRSVLIDDSSNPALSLALSGIEEHQAFQAVTVRLVER
jgi:hypothetical protein